MRNILATPVELLECRPQNAAFHNLCRDTTFLPNLRPLLGLGLNFCLKPTNRSSLSEVNLDKFETDYHRRVMFSNVAPDPNKEIPDLYLPNTLWIPDPPNNPKLQDRLNNFLFSIRRLFSTNKKTHSSLMPHQLKALKWLEDHPEIVVFSADKNLGPTVIERERYVEYAWKDHLSDNTTYRRLSEVESLRKIKIIENDIITFTEVFTSLSDDDKLYILRSIDNIKTGGGFSFMYLTAKIHKTPLKTRAIISYSGSICEGLAKWIDVILKKIIKHLDYICTSSREVVEKLRNIKWDENCLLFSTDAVSMYTNIHFGHANSVIHNFLTNDEKGKRIVRKEGIPVNALMRALEIVMENNVFKFGDTFWIQLAGTAMGSPPAPNYATLYFGIHEAKIIPTFPELLHYCRYIDDTLNIWKPNINEPLNDIQRRKLYLKLMSSYGEDHNFFTNNPTIKPLQWTTEPHGKRTIFLDLDIEIRKNKIYTKIYEKKLNLHLYIPPHSCHSPGVVKGVIFGSVYRALALNTDPKDRMPFIIKTFHRLQQRGHKPEMLKKIFVQAISSIFGPNNRQQKTAEQLDQEKMPLYLQLPFNPSDPHRKTFQKSFRDNILQPNNKRPLSAIKTKNTPNGPVDFDRLQICYRKQKNLGNILSPRKLRLGKFSVKQYIAKLA